MIHPEKMTATIDGDFVLFLIGMRFNQPWKVHHWLPVVRSMGRMLQELETHYRTIPRWHYLPRLLPFWCTYHRTCQ